LRLDPMHIPFGKLASLVIPVFGQGKTPNSMPNRFASLATPGADGPPLASGPNPVFSMMRTGTSVPII
jgi:hypothetical protein